MTVNSSCWAWPVNAGVFVCHTLTGAAAAPRGRDQCLAGLSARALDLCVCGNAMAADCT